VDRLDIQHYAHLAAAGANFLAPIDGPERAVDVGTGTGQWAFDLADELPSTLVVGLDLVPSKPEAPANYRFVRGNVLQGLPFASGTFDFTHQRLMMSGIPLRSWSAEVAELARITRPGGWIELAETDPRMEQVGPSTERLWEMLRRLGTQAGLDATGIVFRSLDDQLRRVGLLDVQRRDFTLPIGRWAGQVGTLLASDLRSLMSRLATTFSSMFGLGADELNQLVGQMVEEFEEHHSSLTTGIAFGRRPG
jgi:SAM-dependent methyltransferase